MTGCLRRLLQGLRLELGVEKVIPIALIDQQWQALTSRGQQRAGIPLAPATAILAQVTGKRLLPPRAFHRIADRGKGRNRPIASGIAQRTHQRPMAAHGVPADAATVGDREVGLDQRRQLMHHIVMHAVMA